MAKRYVVGFLLNAGRYRVALIRKNRPAWQAGKLNGIGGKIEPGESAHHAMAREFCEETGLPTASEAWESMCTIVWPDDVARVDDAEPSSVEFFRYVWSDHHMDLRDLVHTQTDEKIEIWDLWPPRDHIIPNLAWLIPLAAYTADRYEPFTIQATVAEEIGYFTEATP